MEAKQLFEELGYEQEVGYKYIDYAKFHKEVNQYGYVLFDLEKKTVLPTMEYGSTYAVEIDVNLLKAINKQVEELGWNE